MVNEHEFPKTLLSIRSVLEHLEFNSNILYYELGYIKSKHSTADIRMFKQRIAPAIDRVCDNLDELRLIKLKADGLMAFLLGEVKGKGEKEI